MPRKGMRTVFFRSNTTLIPPPSSPLSSSQSIRSRTGRYLSPLYSFSESMLKDALQLAEEMINKWNPANTMFSKVNYLFQDDNRREANEFIKCVNELQRAMNFLIFEDASSEKLVAAHNLMQIAMKRLEKEFYQILSKNRDHLDPESISGRSSHASMSTSRSNFTVRSSFSDFEDEAGSEDEIQIAANSISQVEEVSSIAMTDIKLIADCMISSGFGKECVQIYKIMRKSIVDEGIYRLGVVDIKSYQIRKMDWEVLELKINNWLDAVKIAVRTLFHGERILCDHVFSNSDAIRQSCFSELSKEAAIVLFGFPKKVAKSKKPSPERIFRILDLYKAIAELWPEIDSIFSFESTTAVRSRAIASLTRLGDAVRTMITEFESSINKDSSRLHIHGGAVHPLTRSVANFLCHLSDYSVPLSDIFENWPLPIQTPLPESLHNSDEDPPSAISVRFAWLILVLLCKIDMKVEFYKDVSLSYLFLANNLNFVITKVLTSNQRLILGDDWISEHESKVRQYVSNYEKVGWNKVLSALPEDPTAEILPEEAKIRFKRFNSAFEAIYRLQSSWVVSDRKLRDDIEASLCRKIVPAYTLFYEKCREMVNGSQVKFTPDELTNHISGLFYEKQIGSASRTYLE